MILFIIKKLVTHFLLPPGIFIVILLAAFIFIKRRGRFLALFLAIFIYVLSIGPVKDLLVIPLEDSFKIPPIETVKTGEAYVVLGGGIHDNAPDMDGTGVLGGDALARVFTAYRLYSVARKPIILSGGKIFGRAIEADIAKKTLLSLGVSEKDIITEPKSMDTYENALYVKELCDKHRISRVVLITSAFHMKRSFMLFSRHFRDIIPYPAGYITSRMHYDILSFLPDAGNLSDLSYAVKEYLGIIFYKLKP